MAYDLIKVTTSGEWQNYHAIRRSVLWEARGESGYDDKHPDDLAPTNHPLLLNFRRQPIGTTRLDDFADGTGAMRLVAIASAYQKQGHGRELADRVEYYARSLSLHTLFVNAAPEALGYYEKLGWRRFEWDKSELTGIAADCIQMRKFLC